MIGPGPGSGSGTGGQFNTFPVKGRSNTAGSNATTGGLSLGGDFESSISGALGLGENRDGAPNVTLDGTPWDGSSIPFDPSHNRAQSQESTYLAYNAPTERQPVGGVGASNDPGSTLSVGKGVRFRTPSMEVSGMQPIAPGVGSPMYPGGGSRWRGGGMRASNDEPPLSPPAEDTEDSSYNQPQYAYQYQGESQGQGTPHSQVEEEYYNPYEDYSHTPLSPNPSDYDRGNREPDHATLNIAASREIARELDALQEQTPPAMLPPDGSVV